MKKKKKLISMILWLCTTTYQIKLFFYNTLNSVVPSYYLFNQINLFKEKNDFNIFLNTTCSNNQFNDEYLKLNIRLKIEYYILFLYMENSTPIANYDELIFAIDGLIFKILKINTPNGNQFENKTLFYISFQNLNELNIFMNIIQSGKINKQDKIKLNLSNYFNIPNSISFYNYYNLNNYWTQEQMTMDRHEIFFSINNLYINQIYLYGELFIKYIN